MPAPCLRRRTIFSSSVAAPPGAWNLTCPFQPLSDPEPSTRRAWEPSSARALRAGGGTGGALSSQGVEADSARRCGDGISAGCGAAGSGAGVADLGHRRLQGTPSSEQRCGQPSPGSCGGRAPRRGVRGVSGPQCRNGVMEGMRRATGVQCAVAAEGGIDGVCDIRCGGVVDRPEGGDDVAVAQELHDGREVDRFVRAPGAARRSGPTKASRSGVSATLPGPTGWATSPSPWG